MHAYNGMKPFKQLIVECHRRIIPVKFGQNPPNNAGGHVFEAIVDDGQRAIKTTTTHFEPMAQVR